MTGIASPSLIVKVSFGSSLRRVSFQAVEAVYYEQFKEKIARCFSLDVSSFRIAYLDDDGDATEISSHDDLVEAISYFNDDERPVSSGASSASSSAKSKILMKVRLVIEYDGPNLSDMGSVAGDRRSEGSESGWDDSGHSRYSLASGPRRNRRNGGRTESDRSDDWDDGYRSPASSSYRDGGVRNIRDDYYRRYENGREGGRMELDHRGGRGSPATPAHPATLSAYSNYYAVRPPPPPPIPRHSQHPNYPPIPSPPFAPIPVPPAMPPFYGQPLPWQTHFSPHPPRHPPISPARSESSYGGPPGQPASPLAPLLGLQPPSLKSNGNGGDDSHSSSSGSGSSSRESGVGRAGRRHRPFGDEPTPETMPERELDPNPQSLPVPISPAPHSAPPTYRSLSSNGDVREELSQRWFRAEDARVRNGLHDPKGKGRASEGAYGNGGDPSRSASRTSSDPDAAYTSESEGADDAFCYDTHLDDDGAGPSTFPLINGGRAASPHGFSLPNFLADLSLSRMPAPSILSSVPDDLLRCCGCSKAMLDFRYICSSCGPILPEQAHSDDGTEREDNDDARSDVGTVVTHRDDGDSASEASRDSNERLLSDPLGVLETAAGRVPLPSSPLPHPHNHDHAHDPTSPMCSPVLAIHATESPDAAQDPQLVPASCHDLAHHRLGEEDRGGYELCSECVETVGVRHAAAMSKLAAERGPEDGESQLELRHSFAEVMRMTKSSVHGWREVDYEDDVHCATCGVGPIQTNRFKCLSCVKFELCLLCYRTVEDIHPVHAFLAIPDRPARPRAQSLESVSSIDTSRHATPEEMRLAFLRARGVVGSDGERLTSHASNSSLGAPPRLPPKPMKHPGLLCFGCVGDIVGPRYSCAVCTSFDLCGKCEQLEPPITSPDGRHDQSHILLKISVPLQEDWLIEEASDRARMMSREGSSVRRRRSSPGGRRQGWSGGQNGPPVTYDQWGPPPGAFNHGPPPPGYFGAPPPPGPVYVLNAAGQLTPQYGTMPGVMPLQPLALPGSADHLNHVVHQVLCRGCSRVIRGVRWLCAQCGTSPTFDLCSTCERSSHLVHNPLHCFLRITRPLQKSLPPLLQLLPVLYDPSSPAGFESLSSSGSSRSGSSEGLNDAVVLHQNVICDNCLEAISGPWMRCCHCSTSFDLCCECLAKIEHDQFHIFAKFTRRIDMPLFRDLTRINTPHPQALLSFVIV